MLSLFKNKRIRDIYDVEKNKWYFSVEDIIRILTDSVNHKDYIKKLRKRDLELFEGCEQIVPLFSKMQTAGGMQKVNCVDVTEFFKFAPRTARLLVSEWVKSSFLHYDGEGRKCRYFLSEKYENIL